MMRCILLIMIISFSINIFGVNQTENVILITMDGLRWQELYQGVDQVLMENQEYTKNVKLVKEKYWRDSPEKRRAALMPFFWNTIAKQGQLYGNREEKNYCDLTNKMWFSYPGYNEILSGFADDERINSNDKIPNPNKTVLEFLNEHEEFKGKVAAFGSWDVFPFIINDERSGVYVNAGFAKQKSDDLSEKEKFLNELQDQIPSPWHSVRLDAFTHGFATEYLKKNKPRMLYIAYGETDDFAHDGNYEQYLNSAHRTDEFIKEIWEWVQSTPEYRNKTTIIIGTDHGRGDNPKENWKHHGTKIPDAYGVWLAVLGPDSKALGEVKEEGQLYQNQIAATIAKLFGFEYKNEKDTGEPIRSIIK